MTRKSNEAHDLALAIESLSVENEPDALPRSRVERLALSAAVAPAFRAVAAVAARRRVTIEAPGKPWSKDGETTWLEVLKSQTATYGEVISIKASDGAPDTSGACVLCGMPSLPVPKIHNGKHRSMCSKCKGVTEHCAGWDLECTSPTPHWAYDRQNVERRNGDPWRCHVCRRRKRYADLKTDEFCAGWDGVACTERPPQRAYAPSVVRRRNGEPWRCKSCTARKQSADPEWRKKNLEVARKNMASPQWWERHAESRKRLMADPEWRRKVQQTSRENIKKAHASQSAKAASK